MNTFKTILAMKFLWLRLIFVALPAYLMERRRRRKRLQAGGEAKAPESAEKKFKSSKLADAKSKSAAPILILSFIEWEGAFQRPQHLAHGLAADQPVVFAYWRRVHRIVAAGLSPLDAFGVHEGREMEGRLRTLAVPAFPLDVRWPIFRRLNNLLMIHALRKALGGGPRPRVIVNAPWFKPTLEWLDPPVLIYDIMDELVDDKSKKREEEWLLQRADRVTSGTWALKQKKGKVRGDVAYVPCGVDFALFQKAAAPAEPGSPTFAIKRSFDLGRKPVAGFFGALNHRLDADLFRYLTSAATDFDFLMIGPQYRSMPPTPSLQNWKFPGKVDYKHLPDYIRLFDIALIPYHTNGMNRYLHPVKVMEYLAAEKPVVSMALPDVARFYGDFVALAETPEEFLRAMRDAVESAKAKEAARRGAEYAREHTWEGFVEAFREMIETKVRG